MFPTLMLLGVLLGRWWQAALVVGGAVWPAMLFVDGVYGVELGLLAAALVGLANTAVGVGLHRAVLALLRRSRGIQAAH